MALRVLEGAHVVPFELGPVPLVPVDPPAPVDPPEPVLVVGVPLPAVPVEPVLEPVLPPLPEV
jgi:hypothetical protein